jgi:hypothetical protein
MFLHAPFGQSGEEGKDQKRVKVAVTLDAVRKHIQEHKDKPLELSAVAKPGDKLEVVLEENYSLGYVWRKPEFSPEQFKPLGERTCPETPVDPEKPKVGQGGGCSEQFQVLAAGKVTYKWGRGKSAVATVVITVKAE